jgi:hypothetical protein
MEEGRDGERLLAGAETPSPSPPTTLDNNNNRKLWKLTEDKEGKGESEDMGDESHEDADQIHVSAVSDPTFLLVSVNPLLTARSPFSPSASKSTVN